MQSPLSRLVRLLLILHALMNIALGTTSLISPSAYASLAGNDMMAGASDQAVGAIGLGALGVGWYQLIFAYQGNRALILATVPMRLVFAGVVAGWGNMGAVGYEVGVAVVAALAVVA